MEKKKEEVIYQIEQLLLELLKLPRQPFLLAVEEVMGADYWEARMPAFISSLSECDLDTLQSILENLKDIRQEWEKNEE